MTEMKILTMMGIDYDSFVDQTAREAIKKMSETLPTDDDITELIQTELGVIENGTY